MRRSNDLIINAMGNEKDDQKKQEKWTHEDGLRFLKELREMPSDTSKVGKVFVSTHPFGKSQRYMVRKGKNCNS